MSKLKHNYRQANKLVLAHLNLENIINLSSISLLNILSNLLQENNCILPHSCLTYPPAVPLINMLIVAIFATIMYLPSKLTYLKIISKFLWISLVYDQFFAKYSLEVHMGGGLNISVVLFLYIWLINCIIIFTVEICLNLLVLYIMYSLPLYMTI